MPSFVGSIHLRNRHPVHEVDLHFSRFLVLVGKNDSGKSTLLDCIADVLSRESPATDRPGWWMPNTLGTNLIRQHLVLPPGDIQVTNPQGGATFKVSVGATEVECDLLLAGLLGQPAGDVVRLELSSSFSQAQVAVLSFLSEVVSDSRDAGWSSTGDSGDPTDPRHLLTASGQVGPWVVKALSILLSLIHI